MAVSNGIGSGPLLDHAHPDTGQAGGDEAVVAREHPEKL